MQLFLLLVCLLLLSPQGASLRSRHRSREMKKKVKEAPGGVMATPSKKNFAFDLYRALASTAPDQNIFFSPLSVSTSLAMLSLGAHSSTKAQILEGLGLQPKAHSESEQEQQLHQGFQKLLHELTQSREDLQLNLGNALFVDPELVVEDTYLNAMKTLYLADVFSANFKDPAGAQRQINDYVAKQTKGKIVDLLKHLESSNIMVMVNYIFFKAKWETSFSPKFTQEQDFHVSSETTVRVPMMSREDQYLYLLDQNLSCTVLGLRYQGNATAVFILPGEGKMRQVEDGLSERTLRKWLRTFTKRQLELHLPKFIIEGSYQLEKVLPKLGIQEVFTSQADLSGISSYSNIQVSEGAEFTVRTDKSWTPGKASSPIRCLGTLSAPGALTTEFRADTMPALLLLGLLVATLCPAVLCHPVATAVPQDARQEDTADATRLVGLVSSNADFACSLYKQLALLNQDKNIIFSPLSISTALAFLALGARDSTLTELLQGLKFNLTEMPEKEIHQGFRQLLLTLRQPQEQLQLSLGNALFVGQQLLPAFLEGAQELYAAEALDTNFQDTATAKKLINDHVAQKTENKIVDLIKDLDPQTIMMLVNFILFKAHWEEPFNPSDTSPSKFYLKKDKWVDVPMMEKERFNTPYFRDDELSCTVVQLNYVGNASAFFILPDEDKMQEVEANLSLATLKRWRDSVKTEWIAELHLPKFSISSEFDLVDVLPKLGISEVFTIKGDLSGITGNRNVVVSKAVHKAVLDVAENGTEAAAATAVGVMLTSIAMGTTVRFDRPFLVAVVSTDPPSILFLSKVTNPLQA